MRRTAAALVLTAIGLWLVLSFKSSPLSTLRATNPAPTATTVPAGSSDQAGQAPAGAGPNGSTTTSPPGGTKTLTGSVVPTRYGDVQVAVVVSGTQITDVKALQLPYDRARSLEISDQVAPILRQEVLDAQNAQIDAVSGATFTSYGYAQSLQAALDQLRGG